MNSLTKLNQSNIKKYDNSFDVNEFSKATNQILMGANLNLRNLFLFKDGKSTSIEEKKSFDFNFYASPLANKTVTQKFLNDGYSLQIRGLQGLSSFYYKKSIKEFKKTFCLNNYNLYISPEGTNAFKRHKDPYQSLIYFLKGEKKWQFDNESKVTKSGDLLYIPSKAYHSVETLSHSMHVTSSYYSLPIQNGEVKEYESIPILADKNKSQIIYNSMKDFFQKNMNFEINNISLFNDFEGLSSHYIFYHLSEPYLYIQGVGELKFDSNNEKENYWNHIIEENYPDDFIHDLRARIVNARS